MERRELGRKHSKYASPYRPLGLAMNEQTTSGRRVRIGMVGMGLAASSHIRGYTSHPLAEVVAVCDANLERAKAFAADHNIQHVYSDYELMLDDVELDAVDIATPTFLHAPMAMKAINSGKHVHCEKPFCNSIQEGNQVREAAEKCGIKLLVGETYVFISSHIEARKIIDEGEIGTPLQVRQTLGPWYERGGETSFAMHTDRSWRLDPRQSGGGDYPWIFDHCVHFFATAEYLVPGCRIEEVYAVPAISPEIEIQHGAVHDPYTAPRVDIPIITWVYDDPARTGVWMRAERLNGKYDYRRGLTTTIIGDKGMLEVLGEGGHNLLWKGQQQHLLLHREGKDTVGLRFDEGGDEVWKSDISYYSRGHINQVHHFVDCVAQNIPTRYGGEDGVHAVACSLATILSARERRPVKINEISSDFTAY